MENDEILEENLENDEQEVEVPLFMQEEDEQESSDGVPVSTHVKMKQKLKGKLRESDGELQKLRAEIDQLKGSQQSQPVTRPKIDDFETDDEYYTALEKYEDDKRQQLFDKAQVQQKLSRAQQRIADSVDAHLDRAAKLVEEHSISPEVYQQATETVKEAIDSVHPGLNAFDYFVDTMGEGSEKTIFALGRNKTKLALLKEKLHDDKSGLKAAFYLGQETARLSGAKSKTSRAPAPAAQVKGDEVSSDKGGALKKKYDKAHKAGNGQEAYNLKKQARAQGVDTKLW